MRALQPFAQVFLHRSSLFYAIHAEMLELRDADGRLLARDSGSTAAAVYASLAGCTQTGSNVSQVP